MEICGKMIEVISTDDKKWRWYMISEEGRVLVIGTDHSCNKIAAAHAKSYRNNHRIMSESIDDYSLFF